MLGKSKFKALLIKSFFKRSLLAILFDCLMNSLLTELYKYKKGRVTELARKIQFKKYQQKIFDAVEKLNTKKNIDEVYNG